MDNNFLIFIDEDIEAKKTLLSVMPTKNKSDIKKYNDKIDLFIKKYEGYRVAVRNYITTKSRSFKVKKTDINKEELSNKLNALELTKFVLNPLNTYFEKMGFDNLLYEISNYSEFDFNFVNGIINEFLNKFELANITLTEEDFDYTCYVKEYMQAFLNIRNNKKDNYDEISPIFESIYWVNPNLIDHIKLNFRRLIRENEKKFINYVEKTRENIMVNNDVKDYDDCLDKLQKAYQEVDEADRESVADIIDLAMNGTIDINLLLEDNKVRQATYNDFLGDSDKLNDKRFMEKVYESMEKLKGNIEEYQNYLKFLPLINDFKSEYEKQIANASTKDDKELDSILKEVMGKEKLLYSLNKPLIKEMERSSSKSTKGLNEQQLVNTTCLANEIGLIYDRYDEEYIKGKIMSILTDSLTISQLLHLYYSFDYYKKTAIKRIFNLTKYDEILKYSESFDLFAMNPMNVIIKGILLFRENDVNKVIIGKYRIDGINITEEELGEDSLTTLLDKVNLLLRINEIERNSLTVSKVWFIVNVNKLIEAENTVNK